jgi:NAD(P)-dependent dehydrogenase (short-subunit alcohol dehydrogenase family)
MEGRRMSRAQTKPASTDPLNITADAMLNALPHPVMMIGPDGRIVDANVAAEQFFEASIPMRRVGTSAEIAQAVLWLLSDESSFITGAMLDASGGGYMI